MNAPERGIFYFGEEPSSLERINKIKNARTKCGIDFN
jgi:hypothetical protein